jgi:DNA polymerase III delta prime subunit
MAGNWQGISALLHSANPPSCIIAGPAGCGKSCATRLSLTGTIALWLRCSGDPNLRDARERIKTIARRRVETGQIAWIILEHADALHADAQAFLRRIIETAIGGTRFVLEVRDLASIAEPLLSRCQLAVAPTPLPYEIRAEVMRRAPTVTLEQAEQIVKDCDGNVRWAILQALGSGDRQVDACVPAASTVQDWPALLAALERLNETGSVLRTWLDNDRIQWERAGGACPWALAASAAAAANIKNTAN